MRLCSKNNINSPKTLPEIIFELLNKGAKVSQANLEYLKANYPDSYNYIKQTMVLLFTTPMIHPDATRDGVPIGPTRTAEFDIKNTPMHQLDTNFIPELNAYFAGGKKGKIVKKRKTKKYNTIK